MTSVPAIHMDRGLSTVDCGLWTVDCGLRPVHCGLQTADYELETTNWVYELGIKRGLSLTDWVSNTDSGIKRELWTKCGLPTAHRAFTDRS